MATNCTHESAEGYPFCRDCGKEVNPDSPLKQDPENCGAEAKFRIPDKGKFCRACGKKTGEEVSTSTSGSPA